jgi:transposase
MTDDDKDRRIVELEATIQGLRNLIEQLQHENADLRARLGKDSHNSSKPPSSDGLRKRVRSQRPVGKKSTGGQRGHTGHTLPMVMTPDKVVTHRPTQCEQCHHPLADIPGQMSEERQVHDLPPPVHVHVTAHRSETVVCPRCRHPTRGTFPVGVMPGVQYGPEVRSVAIYLHHYQFLSMERTVEALADLYQVQLSEGTLAQWLQTAALRVEPTVERIKELVSTRQHIGGDETGIRVAGKLGWLHVASTRWLTHLAWHRKRGQAAMHAIGIWPRFHGRAMHDRWASYDTFACQHRLCNVHLVRDLTFLAEEYHQTWAAQVGDLLLDMHTAAREWQAVGVRRIPDDERRTWLTQYFELLCHGYADLPPAEPVPKRRGKAKQHPAKNLLDVLLHRAAQILGFVEDTSESFTNNQREQDLRMAKIHEHISGGFRSEGGATAFCTLRSFVATLRKQGHGAFAAIRSIFHQTPIPVACGLE